MDNSIASALERVRNLGFPVDDYAIFGSGPLIVRNIVPAANDIDIICRGRALKKAQLQGKAQYLAEYAVTIYSFLDGLITCGDSWGIGDPDIDLLIDGAEIIDGLPFVRLEHVVAYKKIRGSDKDAAHLRALDQYLQNLPR